MRYNEQVNQEPKKTKEVKERKMPKQGSYTSKDLENSKDIVWRR